MFPFFQRKNSEIFTVLLIRPSKYDDDGYVVRYWKGILPSNTLAVLNALTREVFESGRFGPNVKPRVVLLDDTVHTINVERLAGKYLGKNKRAVAVFAGVQTNQFPRASELAVRFKQAGFETMVGGFHVSGSIALADSMPPECQTLMDHGITLVKGEVEDAWSGLLDDALNGRLQLFYDILVKPDISHAPLPEINKRYQRNFVYPWMGTIDCGRGCPYHCSFCTIINVQGRKMRCRAADAIVARIEENYRLDGVDFYFFTDDNFARNQHWLAILDGLIDLRERKNVRVSFMMQVDTKAWKIPGFIDKVARAGGTQVFLGIESLNQANLAAEGKVQNAVDDMAEMIAAWHRANIACHAGYIIGFPLDTPETVRNDVARLKELQIDQCSFFMLTPLPGSADHARMAREGVWMEPDLNTYDSCHETLRLPNFRPGEWLQSYREAWESFCSFDTIRATLLRSAACRYWELFKNYMWYRNATLEKMHPMISGFWRLKPRTDRRAGIAPEGFWRHYKQRVVDWCENITTLAKFMAELQELWLQTRQRSATSPAAYLEEIHKKCGNFATRMVDAVVVRWNAMGRARLTTRQNLDAYWARFAVWVRKLRLLRLTIEVPRALLYLQREVRLGLTFLIFFLHELILPQPKRSR
jgi:radical SAM superfamily enzyme YgiQ (UPF0313 family)